MNKSESIGEIAKALVKFNSTVGRIAKDADNPFFKNQYATLDTIIDEVRPLLSENGLSLMQIPSGDGTNVILKTMLIHESGEWMESDELIMKPAKNDPQGVGSTISYARRYSLLAFLSLNTGEDDDGNAGSQQPYNSQNNAGNTNTPKPNQNGNTGGSVASDGQVKYLHSLTTQLVQKKGWTEEQIKQALVKHVGDFSNSYKEMTGGREGQASAAVSKLQELLK